MNEAPLDPLTEHLLDDQRQRWRNGEHRQVESYLEQHAELRDSAEAQMQLIYQEILLREEGGEKAELAEYQARFPSLQEELGLQFAAHELMSGVKADTSIASDGNRLTEPEVPLRCPDCKAVVSRITRRCAACGSPLPAAEVRLPSQVRLPQVPGYEVLARLGAGGMGVVYKARHKELKRDVALKMILPHGQAGEAARVRFRLEAEAVARLHHPNIVQIYDFGEYQGQPYFAMELIEGKSLTAWLKEHPLRPREVAALVETLARAVQAAHNRMLVHRDLKPDNVLMAADGTPKITDFGLARHMDRAAATTNFSPDSALLAGLSDGEIMGTPEYMAPEQARGLATEIGPRSDVYSLGTILYRLLTGESPFVEKHAKSVVSEREKREALFRLLQRVIHEPPERPMRRVTSCDRDLEAICLKCLQKQPDQRYGSAVELAEELARYRRGETVEVRPRGRPVRAWRWCKRNPAVASLLATASLILLFGTAISTIFGVNADSERTRAEKALENLTVKEREERFAKEQEIAARKELEKAQGKLKQAFADLTSKERDEREARAEEARQRRQVERLLYASRLALAQSYWNEGNVVAAREKLDEALDIRIDPGQETGDAWEYRYLHTLMNHRGQRTYLGHTDSAYSVSFSPDGKRIASGSMDRTVKVWDAATGQDLLTLRGHLGSVNSVAFSPDGKRIASGSGDRFKTGELKVWDAVSGQELLTLKGHTASVSSVSFSPDGKLLASGSEDQSVKVWDAASGQELHTLKGHTRGVNSVAFSPDGKRIASGNVDGTVKVWDVFSQNTGQELLTLKGHTSGVTSVCFSPDGRRLASGSRDSTVKVWDAATGQELRTLKGHTDQVLSVSFSPDGKRIASGSLDKTVKVWDVGEPGGVSPERELLTLKGHTDFVYSVSFSPDGKRIASGSRDMTVKVWDAATSPDLLTLKGHTVNHWVVSFSPDGTRIASGCDDHTVKVWDAATGQELRTLKGHTNFVYSVSFSPDGKRIASGSWGQPVRVWDVATGQDLLTLKGPTKGPAGIVYSVRFSPDGKRIASGSSDGTVKVWDAATGRDLLTLKGHTSIVSCVSFSPDGKRIASGGGDRDGTVKVWDAATGQDLLTLKGHTVSVYRVSFSPDGKRLASGSADQTVKVWDVGEPGGVSPGRELLTLKGHTDQVYSVSFSPDGKRIATGSWDRTVKVWDAASGQDLFTLKGHTDQVVSVSFSQDGKRLTSGSTDNKVKVWDAAPGQDWLTLKGHTTHVSCVSFSPDGKRIASGSMDRTVKVWDTASGQDLLTLKGHTGLVHSVRFSPDGKRIASGSFDNTVKVWDAATGQDLLTLKGHTAYVFSVSFSPDGKRIASGSGSRDKTVKVWDAATGQDLLTLKGHTGNVRSVSFSPDGKRLLSKDEGGKQITWDLATGQPIAVVSEPFDLVTPEPYKCSRDARLFARVEGMVIRVHRLPTGKEADQTGYRWWIDPDYHWHEQQARGAEEQAEWFAAAFHLHRLKPERVLNAEDYLRRSHALGQLKKPAEAATDALTAVWLDPQVRWQPPRER